MTTTGRYCKAYYVRQLREFPGWRPDLGQLRPGTSEVDGQEVQIPRTQLSEDDILYVQENYVVTDGIFLDQNIVFGAVTPQWQEFCRDILDFQVPADDTGQAQSEGRLSAGAVSA